VIWLAISCCAILSPCSDQTATVDLALSAGTQMLEVQHVSHGVIGSKRAR